MITRAIAILLVCALTALGWQSFALRGARLDLAQRDTELATAKANAEHDARIAESRLANAASNADAQYARGMTDAQSASDALAAALRAGDVRLRAPWRCEERSVVPTHADDQRSANDAAHERADSATRVVRAAHVCDAQVAALQAYIIDATRTINGAK